MRIISLSPAITEILFALKAESQLIANTYLCNYPTQAKAIPKVGSFSNVDYDKIKSFKPDLIIASTIVQKRISEDLQYNGLKTLYLDPRSFNDILSSIELIGHLLNRESMAHKITNSMKKDIAQLQKLRTINKPRVYIEEWYDPPMYSGNWVPDIVELAGGTYGLAKKGDISRTTSTARLLKFDPEYIFVSYCGFGKKSDINKILNRKGWENITAIKNKNVFALNETILNRPGPRIIKAAREMRSFF